MKSKYKTRTGSDAQTNPEIDVQKTKSRQKYSTLTADQMDTVREQLKDIKDAVQSRDENAGIKIKSKTGKTESKSKRKERKEAIKENNKTRYKDAKNPTGAILYRKFIDEKELLYAATLQDAKEYNDNVYSFASDLLVKKTKITDRDGNDETVTQLELLQRVKAGDYSNMQQLDPVLHNVAAGDFLENRLDDLVDAKTLGEDFTAQDIVDRLMENGGVHHLMNPAFRTGLFIGENQDLEGGELNLAKGCLKDKDAAFFRELSDLCNKQIMVETIATCVGDLDAEKQKLLTEEDKARHVATQKYIIKNMILCHLGRLQQVTKDADPPSVDWFLSVATAYAHCSRVTFTLPGGQEELDKFTGPIDGKKDAFQTRTSSTHYTKRGKTGEDAASGDRKTVEQKSKLIPYFRHQFGCNLAIGGIGNNGLTGRGGEQRPLLNKGNNGHFFLTAKAGDAKHKSSALTGIESNAFRKMNETGHVHNMRATGEYFSSFGGLRENEHGDKYGGRTVDVSYMSADEFSALMDHIDDLVEKMINKDENAPDLREFAGKICGKLMTKDAVYQLIGFQQEERARLEETSADDVKETMQSPISLKKTAKEDQMLSIIQKSKQQSSYSYEREELTGLRQELFERYGIEAGDKIPYRNAKGEPQEFDINRAINAMATKMSGSMTKDEIIAMFDKIFNYGEVSPTEEDEINARRLEGLHALKEVYHRQVLYLEKKYGKLLTQLSIEDYYLQIVDEFKAETRMMQHIGDMLRQGILSKDDPQDAEWIGKYEYFTHLAHVVTDYANTLILSTPDNFQMTLPNVVDNGNKLKDLKALRKKMPLSPEEVSLFNQNVLSGESPLGKNLQLALQYEENLKNGPSLGEADMKKYKEDLKKRAKKQGWEYRLTDRFR